MCNIIGCISNILANIYMPTSLDKDPSDELSHLIIIPNFNPQLWIKL